MNSIFRITFSNSILLIVMVASKVYSKGWLHCGKDFRNFSYYFYVLNPRKIWRVSLFLLSLHRGVWTTALHIIRKGRKAPTGHRGTSGKADGEIHEAWTEKGRYHTSLSVLTNFANLTTHRSDAIGASTLGVLYPSRTLSREAAVVYNITWRGQASLLIFGWGHAKACQQG